MLRGKVAEEYPIIVENLVKVYKGQDGNKDKRAVSNLSLSVQAGECFGLLGPNGAGKSTTIGMMTGFIAPTSGKVRLSQLDVADQFREITQVMGVCPQHDLLWRQLTVREHLYFYGRLKGVGERELKSTVEEALKGVGLGGKKGDSRVSQLSGGMKRRLSVAIAVIGDPKVVFLDEPSTGLDPASRRQLWSVVSKAKPNKGIILTTHSMEEAEVLCDRIGIVAAGQIVCLGNPKQITAKYGGYLVLTVSTSVPFVGSLKSAIGSEYGFERCVYEVGGTVRWEIPRRGAQQGGEGVTLGDVFAFMQEFERGGVGKNVPVLNWGVHSATLEDVFLKVSMMIDAQKEAEEGGEGRM